MAEENNLTEKTHAVLKLQLGEKGEFFGLVAAVVD